MIFFRSMMYRQQGLRFQLFGKKSLLIANPCGSEPVHLCGLATNRDYASNCSGKNPCLSPIRACPSMWISDKQGLCFQLFGKKSLLIANPCGSEPVHLCGLATNRDYASNCSGKNPCLSPIRAVQSLSIYMD